MTHAIFFLLLILPTESHAFSSLWLADPSFQLFAFVQVPLLLIAAKILTETLIFGKFLSISRGMLVRTLAVASLKSVGWAVILTILLIFLMGGLFTDPRTHPLIIRLGVVYFAIVYLWLGWHTTVIALQSLLNQPPKYWKTLAFLANLLCYGGIYGLLYTRLV